ncbi:hypothetical protein F5Y17DRAFT_140821 [Xylariaceae sp. FL0594]|nr:hypothetical protein F5Y17DRAFT_140821 [Xylariaceae sp. FL0594]
MMCLTDCETGLKERCSARHPGKKQFDDDRDLTKGPSWSKRARLIEKAIQARSEAGNCRYYSLRDRAKTRTNASLVLQLEAPRTRPSSVCHLLIPMFPGEIAKCSSDRRVSGHRRPRKYQEIGSSHNRLGRDGNETAKVHSMDESSSGRDAFTARDAFWSSVAEAGERYRRNTSRNSHRFTGTVTCTFRWKPHLQTDSAGYTDARTLPGRRPGCHLHLREGFNVLWFSRATTAWSLHLQPSLKRQVGIP